VHWCFLKPILFASNLSYAELCAWSRGQKEEYAKAEEERKARRERRTATTQAKTDQQADGQTAADTPRDADSTPAVGEKENENKSTGSLPPVLIEPLNSMMPSVQVFCDALNQAIANALQSSAASRRGAG
jgi:flagellar biosynthesis/type III secretory pathway protein FliH